MVRPARFEVIEIAARPTLVLSVVGELDMKTVEVLAAHVGLRLRNGVAGLTLDLRELAFIDSSGLRFLIELSDRARRERWRLRLTAPLHEPAMMMLRATGADIALPFEPSV